MGTSIFENQDRLKLKVCLLNDDRIASNMGKGNVKERVKSKAITTGMEEDSRMIGRAKE